MTEHEPGRELDVMVHRALWPDDTVVVSDFVQSYRRTIGENPYSEVWSTIPAYSTDITAWDWSRDGWSWDREECLGLTIYLFVYEPPNRRKDCEALVPFNYDHPLAAEAFARSLCVLQWAEAKEASDAKS